MSKQKIALVTGGSRGLGKDMVMSLAKDGHDIIFTYHSNEKAAKEVQAAVHDLGQKAVILQLDVADIKSFLSFKTQVSEALSKYWDAMEFHSLVNNAGVGIHASFAETTEEQFDTLVNIHLKSTFFLTQALLSLVADGGHIVNLSSGLARFCMPGYAAYGTMKGAVETLTKYMAKELGARKINVNVVAPGAIETDFGGGTVRDNKDVNALIASQTALGRVGLPEDIGPVVAFLCSDAAHWINAQRIEVSGGVVL
ncbi:short-chain dehydrogenase [Chitinophaga caeni]|uniref:Short-chain dehydrogenase n=1 Tax=Chitinophaga caeni TaxID=2029983 RepID=A0A291QZ32_9BACT|nr:SDR family oxidoreductase [Chitinophaga caeni]ATL49171.1 short-chain dehydrogenase [Chitinophaga caeni]